MTLEEQYASLMLMIVMGIWFGASFSVYQHFVHPRKERRWILLISDPLFWIVQALLLFSFLLPMNEGQLRLYYFLAIALGFSFYKALLEKPFMRLFGKIVFMAVRTGRFTAKSVYRLLIYPIFFLLMLTYRLCRMTVNTAIRSVLFLLAVPLKLLRGIIRMILPDRFLLFVTKKQIQIRQKIGQWVSLLVKRK
ncbi:spore cortex biosynthesis protein YabQ [Sporolactobacillus terrae]|uniref:Spore cortex biosynthesis protein YabQ n=1 Tax=Sporolactobacillus terrae TaxID=269673 RepID=A0ABX5Q3L2_9BACL|nr:spore cortex biosynthesis protein YabQ [Sporolactobacillus terrae]QAA21227.1 spore cortex biosynthesis protein YabQ [Sporolactobacillus terrae]QAA24199.1 spore cortex biosynthesis protein YabQ [Sporolactobacillus terrae]UAK16008.1 spore cortex biosynthesis protein YabQ [Sporolactobacillus terrae]